MTDEQEKNYEVKDKRRVNPDGTFKEETEVKAPSGESGDQSPAEETKEETTTQKPEEQEVKAEDKKEQAAQPELPLVDVPAMLQFMANELAGLAWIYMGLQLPPGKKEPVKDLTQAKVAIDTVVFIADKLQPHMTEDDRRATRALVSDLQLNYVRQSS